jgi:hypothetical protein
MKITILLIVILLCTSSICVAKERTRTGNQLLKDCHKSIAMIEGKSYDPLPAAYCMGYIDGNRRDYRIYKSG